MSRSTARTRAEKRIVNEDDAVRHDFLAELAAQTLEVVQVNRVSAGNVDVKVGVCFFEEAWKLGEELVPALLDGLAPDELVLVGEGFNLRAVDEDVLKGDRTDLFEELSHLRKDVADARAQAFREEAGDGRVVRSRFAFEEVHELDVAAAGF